jgi:hypothetical protein
MQTFNFRDPAFLACAGGVGWEPDPADATLWAWFRPDKYLTEGLPGFQNAISVLGNASDATVNKTDKTNSRNLSARTAGAVHPAFLTEANTKSNLLCYSEDMTIGGGGWAWHELGAGTNDSPTLYTVGAQNGGMAQYVRYCFPGQTYRLTFTARRVTGNTNLQVYHNGSATGASTNVTLTGSLADYTVDFLGRASLPASGVEVGLRDANVAGWGQFEVTKWHLYDPSISSSTYLFNTGYNPRLPAPDGKHRWMVVGPGATVTQLRQVMTSDDPLSEPCTIYCVFYWYDNATGGNWAFSSLDPYSWNIGRYISGGLHTMYGNINGGVCAMPNPQPSHHVAFVGTHVFNDINTEHRQNKLAAGTVGSPDMGASIKRGLVFGGEDATPSYSKGIAIAEILVFTGVAHDTATQDIYIDYLADRYGIVV